MNKLSTGAQETHTGGILGVTHGVFRAVPTNPPTEPEIKLFINCAWGVWKQSISIRQNLRVKKYSTPRLWVVTPVLDKLTRRSRRSTKNVWNQECQRLIIPDSTLVKLDTKGRKGRKRNSHIPPERTLHTDIQPQQAFLLDNLLQDVYRTRKGTRFVL